LSFLDLGREFLHPAERGPLTIHDGLFVVGDQPSEIPIVYGLKDVSKDQFIPGFKMFLEVL
jgi:hypothetical protein